MREAVLRDFFLGAADAAQLRTELHGSVVRSGVVRQHRIADMDDDFVVEPAHLARLCDAVLGEAIPPEALQQVGFCLLASDRFHWDADTPSGLVVAETAADWSCPEVNWPLTLDNVRRYRDGLVVGRYFFERPQSLSNSQHSSDSANLISQDVKFREGCPGG